MQILEMRLTFFPFSSRFLVSSKELLRSEMHFSDISLPLESESEILSHFFDSFENDNRKIDVAIKKGKELFIINILHFNF